MQKQKTNTNIKKIALCSVMIALGTVLSTLKFDAPLGGGITPLSMVPVAFLSCMLGLKWGFAASFVYSAMQLLLSVGKASSWGVSLGAIIVSCLVDYIIAYTVLGFSGAFRNKGIQGIVLGVAMAVFMRFICHYFTGVFIFGIFMPEGWNSVWIYSLCYNGAYMLPEIILTCVGTTLLLKTRAIQKMLKI